MRRRCRNLPDSVAADLEALAAGTPPRSLRRARSACASRRPVARAAAPADGRRWNSKAPAEASRLPGTDSSPGTAHAAAAAATLPRGLVGRWRRPPRAGRSVRVRHAPADRPRPVSLQRGPALRPVEDPGRHRPECLDGVDGVVFAVWAPDAVRVSVVGDFNRWDGRRFPMRSRGASGVWELFLPGVAPHDSTSTRSATGSPARCS